MGLPIFISPPSPKAPVAVVDKAAAGPRSSIRRQSTIRPAYRRGLPTWAQRSSRGRSEYEVWEETHRMSPPAEPVSTSIHASSVQARAAERARMLSEGARLRESYVRRHAPPENELDGPLMPPAPDMPPHGTRQNYRPTEDDIRRRTERQQQRQGTYQSYPTAQEIRRIARRRPAPTPPYTDSDLAEYLGARRPVSTITALSAADQPHPRISNNESQNENASNPIDRSHSIIISLNDSSTASSPDALRPSRSSLSERVHAINTNQRLRQARVTRLDGLGDRDRSLSPENAAAWDTLLESITPDPQPPSVGSSFASAAASTTAGAISAETSLSSLGMTGDSPTLRDCEEISPSASELDDDDDAEMLLGRPAHGQTWRSYASVLTSRSAHSGDGLGSMHRIISRLADREDIPDSWWAGAGLRREPSS